MIGVYKVVFCLCIHHLCLFTWYWFCIGCCLYVDVGSSTGVAGSFVIGVTNVCCSIVRVRIYSC